MVHRVRVRVQGAGEIGRPLARIGGRSAHAAMDTPRGSGDPWRMHLAHHVSPEVASVAERQHGVFTRAQGVAAGMSGTAIGRLLRAGQLETVHRNVYRLSSAPASEWTRASAAVLAATTLHTGDAVPVAASHWTAAALWQFGPEPAPAEAHVTGARQCRARGLVMHRSTIAGDERTVLRGIPVTSPPRTLVDLAGIATSRQLEQAHAAAERIGRVTRREVWAALRRHPGARGCRMLRQLLAELDASGHSPLFLRSQAEEAGLAMVRSGDLPRPLSNARILGLEVDFLWPDLRLVMEVDGLSFHSSAEAVQRDRSRDRTLVMGGYLVLRFTWRQLTQERDECLATLAGAFGARQQLLALGAVR
jgi:very-short-patch-repair endonuclease